MTTHHDAATLQDEWLDLIERLDAILTEAAELRGHFDGGISSPAEHLRSARLSAIRERIRLAWPDGQKPPTAGDLDAMCRADPGYNDLLTDMQVGKVRLAQLEASAAMLEHRIARIRALVHAAARIGGTGV